MSTSTRAQPVHGYAQVASVDERCRLQPSAKNRCENRNRDQETDRKQRRIEIVLFYHCSVLLLNHNAPPSSRVKIQGLCSVHRRLERKVYAKGPGIFGRRFRFSIAAPGNMAVRAELGFFCPSDTESQNLTLVGRRIEAPISISFSRLLKLTIAKADTENQAIQDCRSRSLLKSSTARFQDISVNV